MTNYENQPTDRLKQRLQEINQRQAQIKAEIEALRKLQAHLKTK